MRAFFAGWRRKVGLVTLVIAMVFMGGWLRCFVVDDFELVDFDEWGVATPDQSLCVYRYNLDSVQDLQMTPSQMMSFPIGTLPLGADPASAALQSDDLQLPVVPVGIDFDIELVPIVTVPFWAIILPLTLLSAWLLLFAPKTNR
jgi:hypothetical protein